MLLLEAHYGGFEGTEGMNMKKWLVATLAALVCLLVIPALAQAEKSGTCGYNGSNLTWVLDDEGTLTISGTGRMKDYSYLNNNGTYISTAPWGADIKQVILEPGVTNVGGYAFYGCSSLSSITLPEGLTSINYYAFYNCSHLTSITLPEGLMSIGDYAFSGCSSLTSITLPEGVTSIGNSAFYNCNRLSKIVIPQSVETFGDQIFNRYDSYSGTVYCYEFSGADAWATKLRYKKIYLDNIEDIDSIRTITLPANFRLALEESRTLTVNVFPDYDRPTVTWTSSDPDTVSVENGVVTAHKVGTATITATVGSVSDSVVIRAIIPATTFAFELPDVYVVAKQGTQLVLTDFEPEGAEATITWKSSDTATASINASGYVTTYKIGDATITATSERGISRTCVVHACYPVTAVELLSPLEKLVIGQSVALTANVTMRDQQCVNQLVTFTSSDESVAIVDARGEVLGVGRGSVTITAAAASGVSASVTLEVVPECETHTPEADPEVAPTCTEPGFTAGSHCAACGEVLEPQTEIPALGHDWGEAAYAWAEDFSAVTATRVCRRDDSHMETETAAAVGETVVFPDCVSDGEMTYTSSEFENPAFEAQTTTATIPALGHDWGEATYIWSINYSRCAAHRSCARDPKHTETETARSTLETIIAPTCEDSGVGIYRAAFEGEGFEAQRITVELEPLEHDWSITSYAWSEEDGAVIASHTCANDASHVQQETLSTLKLPEALTMIEEEAFAGSDCQAVILPEGCESVGSRAFADCKRLVCVLAGVDVQIAADAFEGCGEVGVIRK